MAKYVSIELSKGGGKEMFKFEKKKKDFVISDGVTNNDDYYTIMCICR